MKTIFLFFLLGISIACQSQSESYNQRAINLNNKAIMVIRGGGDFTKKLEKANFTLDRAIKIDPKYPMPYQNKLNNLISLRQYRRATAVADSLLNIKVSLEVLTTRGILFQKLGNMVEAKRSYLEALKVGKSNYTAKPSANLLCNIATVYFFLEGEQKAFDFLRSEKEKFSNEPKSLKQINSFEKMMPTFSVDKVLRYHPQVTPPLTTRTSIS